MQRFLIFILVCILGVSASCVSSSSDPKVKKQKPNYGTGDLNPYPLGGNASSPKKTFKLFCEAMVDANVDTLRDITYSVERDQIDWATFEKGLRANRAKLETIFGDAEWQTLQTFRNRGIAMVRWGNGNTEKLHFVFEDGIWKIGGAKKKADGRPKKNPYYVP